jgi:hypothetical protein
MRGETYSHADLEVKSLGGRTHRRLSAVEPEFFDVVRGTDRATAELRCPNCESGYRPGAPAGPHCSLHFAPERNTKTVHDTQKSLAPNPVDAAFIQDETPFVFDRYGRPIIGRLSQGPRDSGPDVDLIAFDVREEGACRLHAKLTRVGEGSSSWTQLAAMARTWTVGGLPPAAPTLYAVGMTANWGIKRLDSGARGLSVTIHRFEVLAPGA